MPRSDGAGARLQYRGVKYLPALVFVLSFGVPATARRVPQVCGTHPGSTQQELFLHRQSQARLRKLGLRTASPVTPDAGNISIVTDADGVVSQRNPFSLQRKAVHFAPSRAQAAAYRFTTVDSDYDDVAAKAGTLIANLDDDDTRAFTLPFAFPFFGTTYNKIWVNSNGNLSFTAGDPSPDITSLGRFVAGSPRIAGFADDLDPTVSSDGVHVLLEPSRFVVSWVNVPEWSDFGSGPQVTMQIRLYPDGRIEISWPSVAATTSVVGITPGNLKGSTELVSFLTGSTTEFSGTVAEAFSGSAMVDVYRAVQRFYESHDDAYDYLVIYNGMNLPTSDGNAIAVTSIARNTRVSGTGDVPFNVGEIFGSPRRLQAVMNMGATSQYPLDPNAHVSLRGPTADTPLTILGHEAGHLYMAYASVRDPGNPDARPMLGRDLFHWSFNFNSDASFLEGNRIRDNGANATPRFETVDNVRQYSPLDQYLMGFRLPEEVPPIFLVAGTGIRDDRFPQAGVSLSGTRRDILIDEIVAAEGRRTPDANVAQRRFRFGFILIQSAADAPNQSQIARVDAYRQQFAPLYAAATGNRATAETELKHALALSIYPAGGVLEGTVGTASISVQTAVKAPLTVLLKSQSGAITLPASVTIPAGASGVTFAVRGFRRGVDDLIAEPSDTTYETGFARVAVSQPSALQLQVVSGGGQKATPGVPPGRCDCRAGAGRKSRSIFRCAVEDRSHWRRHGHPGKPRDGRQRRRSAAMDSGERRQPVGGLDRGWSFARHPAGGAARDLGSRFLECRVLWRAVVSEHDWSAVRFQPGHGGGRAADSAEWRVRPGVLQQRDTGQFPGSSHAIAGSGERGGDGSRRFEQHGDTPIDRGVARYLLQHGHGFGSNPAGRHQPAYGCAAGRGGRVSFDLRHGPGSGEGFHAVSWSAGDPESRDRHDQRTAGYDPVWRSGSRLSRTVPGECSGAGGRRYRTATLAPERPGTEQQHSDRRFEMRTLLQSGASPSCAHLP